MRTQLFLTLLPALALGAPAPELTIEPSSWNFGKISPAQTVTNKFLLKNTGNTTLLIESVKSDCGCTTASLKEKSIYPNQQEPLLVIFNAKNRQGAQDKRITIKSNDPAQPAQRIFLKGEIIPFLKARPAILVISGWRTETIERTIRIQFDRPEKISKITGLPNYIKLAKPLPTSAKQTIALTFIIDLSQAPALRQNSHLTLYTTHSEKPEYRLFYRMQIHATPAQ